MLAGDLRIVQSLAISGPNTLVLRLPPGYNRIEIHHLDPTRLGRIEAALMKISGQTWTLRLESAPSGPNAAPASGSGEAATDSALSRTKRSRAEAIKQPLVARAMDLLGAQIVQLDEERKGAIVSNLLVVLCAEQPTQPVVNAGSLYA